MFEDPKRTVLSKL